MQYFFNTLPISSHLNALNNLLCISNVKEWGGTLKRGRENHPSQRNIQLENICYGETSYFSHISFNYFFIHTNIFVLLITNIFIILITSLHTNIFRSTDITQIYHQIVENKSKIFQTQLIIRQFYLIFKEMWEDNSKA